MFKNKQVLLQGAFIALLAVLTYANTFNYGMNLDDFLIQNGLPDPAEGWRGVIGVFGEAFNYVDYRPVGMLTFAIEQQFTGTWHPPTSHVVNVVLFAICCLLLFTVIRRLPVKHAGPLAFICTVLFAVHPIHSNVVSSIKNRDGILSAIFGLLSLLVILKALSYKNENRIRSAAGTAGYVFLAFVCFLAGSMAKLDAVTFVFILPVAILLFSIYRTAILYSGILGFVFFQLFNLIRFRLINPRIIETYTVEDTMLVTENNLVMYDGLVHKLSAALVSLFYYLKFHIVPTGYYYYFGYDMIPVDALWSWQNAVAIFFIAVSAFAFFRYFKRSPEIPLAIGIFFGGLTFCLNVYQPVAGIVAPRLGFIASIGGCMLLGILILNAGYLLEAKLKKRKWRAERIQGALLGGLVLIFLPFTVHRNTAWKDIWTLIERDAPHLERSFEGQRIACMNYMEHAEQLGVDARAKANWQKCLHHCTKAHEVYDEDQFVEEAIGLANYNLGNYQASYDQFRSVIQSFDTTRMAYEFIAEIFQKYDRPDSAARYLEQLIRIEPDYQAAHIKYTQNMVRAGKVDEAIAANLEFARSTPDYKLPFESLGYLFLLKNDTLRAADFLFYAISKGSPGQEYIPALEPYFRNNGREDEWNRFMRGEVSTVEELLEREL